jgi:hypothetical protein
LRQEGQDAKAARKVVVRKFFSLRALRARSRKRASRRSIWQPGRKWGRFERFVVARRTDPYPLTQAQIAGGPARAGARHLASSR